MLRSQFESSLQAGKLAKRSMGLSLGAAMLLSGMAIAAPGQAQTTSPSGDIVVPTEGSGSTSTGSGSTTTNPPLNAVRFACQTNNGQPTVMYMPESQPNQAYAWAVPSTLGGGWSSDRRCAEIARRLESYRPDGLVEMRTGLENGYNTICVTTDRVPSCRIVLTVPPGQDPTATRDRVFQNLTIADSGQQTQGVLTFGQNGRDSNLLNQIGGLFGLGGRRNSSTITRSGDINLKPFLDRRDGGTGERLSGGVSIRSNSPSTPRKPGLFRR
jgi:Circadian oscillating protein COP23